VSYAPFRTIASYCIADASPCHQTDSGSLCRGGSSDHGHRTPADPSACR